VTFFNDLGAETKTEESLALPELAELIRTASAPEKALLPLLKLAVFGNTPTEKKCLRHDRNVIFVSGVEADYDGEIVSFDEAIKTAQEAGLLAIIYTSPSHAPERPRWRILCPTSSQRPPVSRTKLFTRINGLYGGIFAKESWSLSQSYYYGAVDSNSAHRVEIVDGQPIDLLDELDEIAIGKTGASPSGGNGADHAAGGPVDEATLLEQIRTGASYHTPSITLLGLWANRGASMMEAKQRLLHAFETVFPPDRDARWHARVAEIPRLLGYVWGKQAEARDTEGATFDAWERQQPPPVASIDAESAEIEVCNAADIFGETLAPRGWVLGNVFCKQFPSSLAGAGGTAKTAVRITQALSVATGRSLTGEHVHKRSKVLFLSFEDGISELKRRLLGAMLHHHVSDCDVDGWLFFAAVRGHKLIKTTGRGNTIVGTLEPWLRQKIQSLGVELVILDPFIKTHDVEENDNTGIDAVCTLLAQLAIELDVAVDYLHHVRKGPPDPGNADIARGASAAKDAGRLVYTLTPMTPEEAQMYGADDALRRCLVRQEPAKVNIAPPTAATIWFKIVGVPLNNGTPEYPQGDTVQTVERWAQRDFWADITIPVANRILDMIDQGPGPESGRRYSPAPQAKDRAAWVVVQEICPNLSETQCKKVIAKWLENGVLVVREHVDPKDRHKKPGLLVGNRPGNEREI
jgi:hypothetical protein